MKKVWKVLIRFVVIIIAISLLVIVLIFYGPWGGLKSLWVTTAMTTMSHQYLAEIFVNKEEIKKILEENKVKEPSLPTNTSLIASASNKIETPITFERINTVQYKGYLLKVSDPALVTLGITKNLHQTGMKVEEIVKTESGIAGINAGGFDDDEGHGTGGTPLGIAIKDGSIIYQNGSKSFNIIGFNQDNILILGRYTLAQINKLNLRDAVSFDPFLVVNGEPMIKKGNGGWGIAPRTAIGQTKDGTVLLLVIDGRQISSIGASLKDVMDIMLENGAVNVANLDGGSSSTMYYKGDVVNSPSSMDGPRNVPTAFVVKDYNSFKTKTAKIFKFNL